MDNNPSAPLHILVVEDSSSARMTIVSTLSNPDTVIHEADDGATAYALLKENPTAIDLVLSDLVMTTMHGDELCHKIRNSLGLKDLPVIILSSQTDKDTILRLFNAGANDYLFKPFIPEELVARIRSHLDQRRLHKLLLTNIEELSELNQMKDHFLAACSHDFRSPLQGILGFTELLFNDNTLDQHHKEILKHILESGNQLHGLIESLLDFSLAGNKPEDITMVPLEINDLIHACITNISLSADNKGIKIDHDATSDIPLLKGNPNALSRVIHNLLSNAVKFTEAGGHIKVRVSCKEDTEIKISVIDNGVGIARDSLPTVFDRYSKASRTGTRGEKSTGLGLYITKQLLDLHCGHIDVTSEIGQGSCFTISLPLNHHKD